MNLLDEMREFAAKQSGYYSTEDLSPKIVHEEGCIILSYGEIILSPLGDDLVIRIFNVGRIDVYMCGRVSPDLVFDILLNHRSGIEEDVERYLHENNHRKFIDVVNDLMRMLKPIFLNFINARLPSIQPTKRIS